VVALDYLAQAFLDLITSCSKAGASGYALATISINAFRFDAIDERVLKA